VRINNSKALSNLFSRTWSTHSHHSIYGTLHRTYAMPDRSTSAAPPTTTDFKKGPVNIATVPTVSKAGSNRD
jgi:hypothetical protein